MAAAVLTGCPTLMSASSSAARCTAGSTRPWNACPWATCTRKGSGKTWWKQILQPSSLRCLPCMPIYMALSRISTI